MEGGETCLGAGLQNAERVDVPIHISEEELRVSLEYNTSFFTYLYTRILH